ncbi:MAG: DUF1015 domain-containing protein [Dehalococcoidales bacterium]
MADVRPFHGIHYNPSVVKDLATVICPPYDIISMPQQLELYRRSDFNFVRIEYGREYPHDKDTENKYTRAAATLESWLKQHILETDKRSCFYVDDHQFKYRGKTLRRRGIAGVVKLEEWDRMIVRPHEGTLSRPKGDRLSLLWALKADTSPIMALYEDSAGKIKSALEAGMRGKPAFNIGAVNGESHRMWAISDEKLIGQISGALANQPLYIADGHHRYESALAYQREKRTSVKTATPDQPFDFVMMALIDFADPGLIILPAHRMVRGIAQPSLDKLADRLKAIFQVEEVQPNKVIKQAQIDSLLTEKNEEVNLLLCGPGEKRFFLLTLRDFTPVRPMMPYFHSELYQKLDVSIVDHVILEELLGLTHEAAGTYIDYTNDAPEAIKRVQEQEYQLAIIVNPVRPQAIKAIADSSDRMPRKSTYFHPKVPAGIVMYRLE